MKENIKKIKKNKKALIMLIVAGLSVIALSYAFFAAFIGNSANTEVTVGTGVLEKLIFTKGEDFNLLLNQETLAEGSGSVSDESTSKATLIADSDTNTASDIYNAYFNVNSNSFIYTVDESTPEILLEITDNEGNKITNLENLTYKTVTDASTGDTLTGFDITTYTGIIKLKENIAISTNNSNEGTTHNWTAKITFVNLATNQNLNEGKSLEAEFILQKEYIVPNEMISGPEFYDLTVDYRGEVTDPNYQITQIEFASIKDVESYNNASVKWDVSKHNNESVVAYIEDTSTDKILHIEADGIIAAHPEQTDRYENEPDSLKTTFTNFQYVKNINFNSSFNTEYVNNMDAYFYNMIALKSLDVSSLTTENVTDMGAIFSGLTSLTSINLSNIDTSNVTKMNYMFNGTTSLQNINLSNFNTSNLEQMEFMFNNTGLINLDLSNFDTSNVVNMEGLFASNHELVNLDISNFDTSNVVNMKNLFFGLNKITTLNLLHFDTSKVENMSGMFNSTLNLENLDISNLDTSNVKTMGAMFHKMHSLVSLDISNFDTTNVIDMNYMFNEMHSIKKLDLSNFNTSNVTNMEFMFTHNVAMTELNISSFDTSKVTNMNYIFSNCPSLTEIDVTHFRTPNLIYMADMFSYNDNFTHIDLSNFDTSNVQNMRGLFHDCDNLTNIDISSFDTSNTTQYDLMFTATKLSGTFYAKNQEAANKFNETQTSKPSNATFVVKS